MNTFLVSFGAALLVIVVGTSAALLLSACALRLPGMGWMPSFCPTPQAMAGTARQSSLSDDNRSLMRQIAALQRGLAEKECTIVPSPVPVAEPPAYTLDPEAFRRRDTAILDGCWELDSEYRTVNEQTRAVTHYSDWTICFEPGGAGRESMIGRQGSTTITCEGPVTRAFDADGALLIAEPANLPCSNGIQIFRREITCKLDASGRADCSVLQPERGRNGSVVALRRAKGHP